MDPNEIVNANPVAMPAINLTSETEGQAALDRTIAALPSAINLTVDQGTLDEAYARAFPDQILAEQVRIERAGIERIVSAMPEEPDFGGRVPIPGSVDQYIESIQEEHDHDRLDREIEEQQEAENADPADEGETQLAARDAVNEDVWTSMRDIRTDYYLTKEQAKVKYNNPKLGLIQQRLVESGFLLKAIIEETFEAHGHDVPPIRIVDAFHMGKFIASKWNDQQAQMDFFDISDDRTMAHPQRSIVIGLRSPLDFYKSYTVSLSQESRYTKHYPNYSERNGGQTALIDRGNIFWNPSTHTTGRIDFMEFTGGGTFRTPLVQTYKSVSPNVQSFLLVSKNLVRDIDLVRRIKEYVANKIFPNRQMFDPAYHDNYEALRAAQIAAQAEAARVAAIQAEVLRLQRIEENKVKEANIFRDALTIFFEKEAKSLARKKADLLKKEEMATDTLMKLTRERVEVERQLETGDTSYAVKLKDQLRDVYALVPDMYERFFVDDEMFCGVTNFVYINDPVKRCRWKAGRFVVKVDFAEVKVHIYSLIDGDREVEAKHPHVNGSYCCLGSLVTETATAVQKKELFSIFFNMRNFLSSVNRSSMFGSKHPENLNLEREAL
jgi:hypothetical protein